MVCATLRNARAAARAPAGSLEMGKTDTEAVRSARATCRTCSGALGLEDPPDRGPLLVPIIDEARLPDHPPELVAVDHVEPYRAEPHRDPARRERGPEEASAGTAHAP